jgi:hypothetical protein
MGRIARYTMLMVLAHLILLGHIFAEIPGEKNLPRVKGEEKIELLNHLAFEYYKIKSYEKCISFASQALELSGKTGDLNAKIEASSLLSCCYLCTHNEKKASKFSQQTVTLCKENGKEEKLADFYITTGSAYRCRVYFERPKDLYKNW